jgi:electron transfer flavoprotein beta subunit
MHLIVCVKQIPNPEAAFSMLKVDETAKKVVPAAGLQLVMSPFDEQAVEAALRIRDARGEARITALCMGPESARSVLKHALAMGADEAVLVRDEALEDPSSETAALALASSETAALALARAIAQLAPADLILTGRQAADWDSGIVGAGIAELLDMPLVTFARKVEIADQHVRVERVLADGYESVEAELPAVVTISNELGAARAPSLRETMRAARKPLAVRSASDIGLVADDITEMRARRERERLFVPEKQNRCELIAGADAAAQAAVLISRLREARLL